MASPARLPKIFPKRNDLCQSFTWVPLPSLQPRTLIRYNKRFVRIGSRGNNSVIIGVPKESYPGERRVALVPVVIPNLVKAGFEVAIEKGAGVEAGYPDALYVEKGAKILPDRAADFCDCGHHRSSAVLRLQRPHRESRSAVAAPRPGSDRISASAGIGGSGSGDCRKPA